MSVVTDPAPPDPEPASGWRTGLREYQIEAVKATVDGLVEHSRGTVVMACGSGKTLVGVRAANVLAGGSRDSVLVLAPSLALLDQLYRHWRDHTTVPFTPLAVCSDDELGTGHHRGDDDTTLDPDALQITATTNPTAVAAFLASATDQPKVVFATYHSSPVVADATMSAGHVWSLAICDEAHRTAGRAGATFTTVLSNAKIPSRKRLFLTASPRVHATATSTDGRALLSMDNEAIYGPRLYTYTFGRGIAEGWLSDYRVLVLVVDSEEIYHWIHHGEGVAVDGRAVNATRAAGILGLLRAAKEHDLSRVIAFHNTISASRQFATDLSYLSGHIQGTGEQRPVQPYHLDGLASPQARRDALAAIENPPADTSVVVNNVRVLGEGVDIPALDGVMFAEPKSSQIDVIQAVGRAIRPNPDRDEPSVVIVPVYLARDENPDAVLSGSTFKHVWQVLNALRDHDAALDAQLAAIRRNAYDPTQPVYEPGVLPERILVQGLSASAEEFSEAIVTMLLDHTTTTWTYGYDRFVDYTRAHDTGDVPSRYVDPTTGFPLGSWVQSQRQAYRWGRLSVDQVDQLEAAGFDWGQRSAQWRKDIALFRALATGTGSQLSVADACLLVPSLAPWFRKIQQRARKDRLTDAERHELSDMCQGWAADPFHELGGSRTEIDDLAEQADKQGRLSKKYRYTLNGQRVRRSTVVALLQAAARQGLLDQRHRDALSRAGIDLPPADADTDVTSPDWESAALRKLAAATAQVDDLIADKPGTSKKRQRPATVGKQVTLQSLLEGPRGFAERLRMVDPPKNRHEFGDALAHASDLVEDAEYRAGRDDDFVVRADHSVWRRPQGSDQWSLAGRYRDHVDSLICVVQYNPGTPDGADRSDGLEDDPPLSIAVEADLRLDELPKDLTDAVQEAVMRTLVPDYKTLLVQLLKSYGIPRVREFSSQEEAEAYLARAHKRREQPAVVTPAMIDATTDAMEHAHTKILRESLALTLPKVAHAYRAGRLKDWTTGITTDR